MATKHIFVTGGVVSSLGKGITAASLGRLLKSRGLKVTIQKLDPYLNVDPGTMSPFQHGEVFVTDDGAETDLDLGHYERFIDESLSRDCNVTAGSVYQTLIGRERRGDFLGGTVQVIPHVTNEIKDRINRLAEQTQPDVIITEVGGTVGDIESLPFLEAIRQLKKDMGRENVCYIHVTLVPWIARVERAEDQADAALGQGAALASASSPTSSSAAPIARSTRASAARSRCSATSTPTRSSRRIDARSHLRGAAQPARRRVSTRWSSTGSAWSAASPTWPSGTRSSRTRHRLPTRSTSRSSASTCSCPTRTSR